MGLGVAVLVGVFVAVAVGVGVRVVSTRAYRATRGKYAAGCRSWARLDCTRTRAARTRARATRAKSLISTDARC